MSDKLNLANHLRAYGYSVGDWDTFIKDKRLPDGLLERAERVREELISAGEEATHVAYDTNDNDQGFMIIGGSEADVAWEFICGPLEGTLELDAAAPTPSPGP